MKRIPWFEMLGILWVLVDGLASILYSTDLIPLFQAGRIVRLVIALGILTNLLPVKYWKVAGVYLGLEAIGSVLISPDAGPLWQLGRIGRVLFGAYLYDAASE